MHLNQLRPVFEASGPYTGVHLDVSRSAADAETHLRDRWFDVRRQLEKDGAPTSALDAIGERVLENHHRPGEQVRTVVASDDKVVLDDLRAQPDPTEQSAVTGSLPDLAPWLRVVEQEVPFVLVVADREGAEVTSHRAWNRPGTDPRTVQGGTLHITKVAGGDMAQKEYHRSAENTWHQNAQEVAETVRKLPMKPRVVFVAGEVRARSEITDLLREHIGVDERLDVLSVESGGRAAGASEESLWAEVQSQLGAVIADEEQETAERVQRVHGQGSGLVHGVAPVLGAFAEGRVEHLVLDLDTAREEQVYVRDYPGLAVPPGTAADEALPADQVMVAAATLTDASLSLVPPEMLRGMSDEFHAAVALLRWSEPGGTS